MDRPHSLFLLLLPRALQVVGGHVDESHSLLILPGRQSCLPPTPAKPGDEDTPRPHSRWGGGTSRACGPSARTSSASTSGP